MANGLQQKSYAFGFEVLSGWEGGSKMSLFQRSQLAQRHKMQHDGKMNLTVIYTIYEQIMKKTVPVRIQRRSQLHGAAGDASNSVESLSVGRSTVTPCS